MKEKIKCPNCKLLIDDDSITCPYCGYKLEEEDIAKQKEEKVSINYKKIDDYKSESKKSDVKSFIKFESRSVDLKWKNIVLLLVGFIGFQMIATILQIFALTSNPYFLYTSGIGYINFASYFFLLGIMVLILNEDLLKFVSKFKKGRTYLYGFSYGFLLIAVSVLVNMICSSLSGSNSTNNNESNIESIATSLPILSIIVFGFVGPFCEELTYRVGLFSFINKKSRVLAYIITPILFGFIHFDFSSSNIINELINIPSYIVSGLLLSYFYDKEGMEVSFIAHATNNLVSIILTIIGALA